MTSAAVEAELSSLWGSGQEWILIFDKLLKHPNGKPKRGCRCDVCEADKPAPSPYSPQVWSLSGFKVSRQILTNDLNQVLSVCLLMTSLTALANEGLSELTWRPSLIQAS